MSTPSKLALAATCVALSGAAIAQPAHGPSVQEISSLSAQLRVAELKARIAEAERSAKGAEKAGAQDAAAAAAPGGGVSAISSASPPVPSPTEMERKALEEAREALARERKEAKAEEERKAKARADDIRLMAVYGVADNLRAEVFYNQRTIQVSMNGNRQVGRWTLKEITPYKVTLAHESEGSSRDIYMGTQERVELHAQPMQGKAESQIIPPRFGVQGNFR